MASNKPVVEKLLIKEGFSVLILDEPEKYRNSLGTLPKGVKVVTSLSGSEAAFDIIQVFVKDKTGLEAHLPKLKPRLKAGGILWVCYPKGASKIKTDINRDRIQDYVKTIGMIGVAMIAIDDTWSALRLKSV